MFQIILVHPEIPQNTGAIGRLCVSTGTRLHLVKPIGFSLEDKYVRRAGMDYWPHLDLHLHENFEAFLRDNPDLRLWFFSTKGTRAFWDCDFHEGDGLVFGAESCGLPPELYERYRDRLCLIPMTGDFYRSLNLANSAAVGLFEAMRQVRCTPGSAPAASDTPCR